MAKTEKDLCSFATKSKIFKIQNKPNFPFQKFIEPNSDHAFSIISHLKEKEKRESHNYMEPRPIENILKLRKVPFRYSENVCLNYRKYVHATTCELLGNRRFYLSDGVKVKEGITFQFLLGNDETNLYCPRPLAVIGKHNLKLVEEKHVFEKRLSKLRTSRSK